MANRVIPKASIDAIGLLRELEHGRISIRELSKRERVGYSERQLRYFLKRKEMPWELIFKICGELDLAFMTIQLDNGTPYVTFCKNDSEDLGYRMDHNFMGWTFWTPVLDPCGFEYPIPVTR